MDEQWGPWIVHDGSGCPCVGMFVHVVYGRGADGSDPADYEGGWELDTRGVINNAEWIGYLNGNGYMPSWVNDPDYYPVHKYRIRKPRGLTILEQIARQPEKELEEV